MSDQWHLLQDGRQYGPYGWDQLVQFVKEGRIVRDTMLWTDGMENWVLAPTLQGLFPAEPAPAPTPASAAAPVAAPAPRGGAPKPVAAAGAMAKRPGQGTSSQGRPAGQSTQMAPRSQASQQAERGRQADRGQERGQERGRGRDQDRGWDRDQDRGRPSGPYPHQRVAQPNYELLMALLCSGLILVGIGFWAKWQIHLDAVRNVGSTDELVVNRNQELLIQIMWITGPLCLIAGTILNFVYLSRLWQCLQNGKPRTTPGLAVGLLLVPLFNLYWIFVAYYGLACDYNRIIRRYPDLRRAPRMSEGLFLAYCICSIVAAPVALVMWFPVMLQVCKAIQFMAMPPAHRMKMPVPR